MSDGGKFNVFEHDMLGIICLCCKKSFFSRIVSNSIEFSIPRKCHKCQICVEQHVSVQRPLIHETKSVTEKGKKENFLIAFNQNRMICELWCLETSKCIRTFQFNPDSLYRFIVIQNKKLLTLNDDGYFCLYDLSDGGKCITSFYGNDDLNDYEDIHIVSKNQVALAIKFRINIYDIEKGCLDKYFDVRGQFITILFLRNRNILYRNTGINNQINVIDYESGKVIQTITENYDIFGSFNRYLELENGNLAVGTEKKIMILNIETGRWLKNLNVNGGLTVGLVQTPNGHLISSSANQTIKIWDTTKNYECIRSFKCDAFPIEIKLNSQEKLVSLSPDQQIRVWNLSTGKCLNYFRCENISKLDLFFN